MAEPVAILPWATQDRVPAAAVVAMWTREGALPLEEAERRVRELLLVAAIGPEPVGVCTAYVAHSERLRLPLWHFRAFVAAAHRRSDIAIHLLARGRDHLRERHLEGIDRRGAGVLIEVENEALKRHMDQAHWPRTGFTFIGRNERGDHLRVSWFPDARVPVQGSA